MNCINKLRQKTEQLKKKIKRRVKSIYILIKKNPKYILNFAALKLFWIIIYIFIYVFGVIINLPVDSIIKKFIDGSIHIGKIFEWLKDFIVNIDFKKIVSFLQNVPLNFRQIMTIIVEFISKWYRDLKQFFEAFYRKKYVIAQIKLFLIKRLPKVKRIIKSGIKVICCFICTKMGMLFIIPFLGIKIIFVGKDISIVATLILCGIFSLIGTQIGKLIGGKSASYFLSKFHKKKYNR